jgi:ribosomal protein S18 acetylase RimI-like enzyme
MNSTQHAFEVAPAERLSVRDAELSELLTEVYVGGGYTPPETAVGLFAPTAVRQRGILIGARERAESTLAGMVVVVPPDSPARRLARSNQAEMHLLGVRPQYRGQGLGRMLVDEAIAAATRLGCTRLILWTQPSMEEAQQLYESAGFIHTGDMNRDGRPYKVYERVLHG